MPTVPPSAAVDLPDGVAAADVLWDEVVAGGGYTRSSLPRGARLRLTDLEGDACAGVLLHRADRPSERLNVADTVKVQWQAYLGTGQLLLSDMGRVLAAIVEDTSGRHDAFCGTTHPAANAGPLRRRRARRAGPNGRDHFGVALAKLGLDRRDVAPNVNLFKGVRVEPRRRAHLRRANRGRAATSSCGASCRCSSSIVNVPHPLDPRPAYTVTPLRVTAWRGDPAATTTRSAAARPRPNGPTSTPSRRWPPVGEVDGFELPAGRIVHDEVVRARAPWSRVVEAGQTLRIIDVGGNQAVDCVLHDAHDLRRALQRARHDRRPAQRLPRHRHGAALHRGQPDDDHHRARRANATTPSAAPAPRSRTRSATGSTPGAQHACVENFVHELGRHGLGKRDLQSNINWFMNVPVDPDGSLGIVDGISAPGLWVDLRAERDVLVVVSNCPQINNPCNGFDPTPVRMVVADERPVP